MAENKEMIAVQKENISLLDRIRRLFNRTSKYVDSKGRTKYISYPPRRGFTEKQKGEIVEIEINDVDDLNIDDLAELRALQKLTLGEGVQSVSHTDKNLRVDTIVLSDEIKNIPEGILEGVHTVIGRDVGLSIKAGADSIFIDENGRLNVDVKGRLSKGQEDYLEQRKRDISQTNDEAAGARTEKIIEDSNQLTNARSIYVYRTDANHSLRVVVDDYPMKGEHAGKIPNSDLVGILVNDAQEVTLEDLTAYPNLRKVVIGKNVQRVRGNLGKEGWVTSPQLEKRQKKLDEYGYDVSILSKNTVTIDESPKVPTENEDEKILPEIEQREDR